MVRPGRSSLRAADIADGAADTLPGIPAAAVGAHQVRQHHPTTDRSQFQHARSSCVKSATAACGSSAADPNAAG
jgi:hypothetical protein